MTIRFFCDVCTEEVQEPAAQREFRTTVKVRPRVPGHTDTREVGVQLIRSIDGVWNAGHICNRCLRKALEQVIEELVETE